MEGGGALAQMGVPVLAIVAAAAAAATFYAVSFLELREVPTYLPTCLRH